MKLNFSIEVTEEGVKCSGTYNEEDVYNSITGNLMAVAALEVAKNSLIAKRWGMQGNSEALIQDEKP